MNKNTPKNSDAVLPFDIDSLGQGIRVKPAAFARMCNVSRQAVSQWIKQGKITLFLDGTLDPRRAAQSVLDNTDPARMRAKVFQVDVDEATEKLREKIAEIFELTEKIKLLHKENDYLRMIIEEIDLADEKLKALLLKSYDVVLQTNFDQYPDLIESLFDQAILDAGRELGNI